MPKSRKPVVAAVRSITSLGESFSAAEDDDRDAVHLPTAEDVLDAARNRSQKNSDARQSSEPEEEEEDFGSADEDEDDQPSNKRQRAQADEAMRPEQQAAVPPVLRQWAQRFRLGPQARDLLEDRYQLQMSYGDDPPTVADIFDWARDLSTWENSTQSGQMLEQVMRKIDQLKDDVEKLKKGTGILTKGDLNKLGQAVAFVFFSSQITEYSADSSIATRTMKFLKANPHQVGQHFKELVEDPETCDCHVEPKVKQLLNRMRDMCATRVHKSMGVDDDTEVQSGDELWDTICKGYKVPFTKERAMRLLYIRFVATQHAPREKNGKPVGDFWETVDATLKEFRQLQDRDPDAAKKELEAVWVNDKKRFGSFDDRAMTKADEKGEEALANAARSK